MNLWICSLNTVCRCICCSGAAASYAIKPHEHMHCIVQVGDASGIQSPLSFGGFGALTRHLGRLTSAITEALQVLASNNPTSKNLPCQHESTL